jgi:hypothetical protein
LKIEINKFKDLSSAREFAKNAVDAAAERARNRYITPGAGQAMEYMESYQQAKMKLQNPALSVPMVAADVVARVRNPMTQAPIADEMEAAAVIVFMYEAWQGKGSDIRQLRLKAKVDIDEAADQRSIAQIREAAIEAMKLI